ncbi:MAG: DNA repair protein RadC [Rikenellaceae bacterium]
MISPSQKLMARGVEALSDEELLALLLDDGSSSIDIEDIARRVISHFGGSLREVLRKDISRLRMVEGLGLRRAQRLVVAAELGRRTSQGASLEQLSIKSSGDVIKMFRPQMETLNHEECWVVYLTASNRIIESQRVSQGGITSTTVDHRLIVKRALELLTPQIIVIHNHPSGSVEPSEEDIELTQKIKSAAALFDIKLLDHIIISASEDYSFLHAQIL